MCNYKLYSCPSKQWRKNTINPIIKDSDCPWVPFGSGHFARRIWSWLFTGPRSLKYICTHSQLNYYKIRQPISKYEVSTLFGTLVRKTGTWAIKKENTSVRCKPGFSNETKHITHGCPRCLCFSQIILFQRWYNHSHYVAYKVNPLMHRRTWRLITYKAKMSLIFLHYLS